VDTDGQATIAHKHYFGNSWFSHGLHSVYGLVHIIRSSDRRPLERSGLVQNRFGLGGPWSSNRTAATLIQHDRQNGSRSENRRRVFLTHSPAASSERVVCVPHCVSRTTELGQVVPISIVTLSTIWNKRVPSIHILVRIVHNGRKIDARALLDSGTEGIYCNAAFVNTHGFPLLSLENPIFP